MHSIVVALLVFTVNCLLLLGTCKSCGVKPPLLRITVAAAVAAVHAGICLVPGWGVLGSGGWYVASIFLVGSIAFGLCKDVMLQYAVFFLLRLAIGGLSQISGDNLINVVIGLLSLCTVLILGLRQIPAGKRLVPVEMEYKGRRVRILALRDTGNTLRDPITGKPVLVVDAKAAQDLTGLPRELFSDPVEALSRQVLPGLRLIPYQSVDQSGAMLLGLRIDMVRIGAVCDSQIVAFAPICFETEEGYQALTGGME